MRLFVTGAPGNKYDTQILEKSLRLSFHPIFNEKTEETQRQEGTKPKVTQEMCAQARPDLPVPNLEDTGFLFFFFFSCHHLAPVGLNAAIIYYFCKKEEAWEPVCFPSPPGGLFLLALHENGQAVGSAG